MKISVTSIAAFAANASANTETAFEQFCKGLYQTGATKDMIRQKEDKILEILTSHGMVASSQIGGSGTGDEDNEDKDDGDKDEVLEAAYTEYCKDLQSMGMTEDMIRQNEGKIREVLRSRGMVADSNAGGSSIGDKGQLLQAGFSLLRLSTNSNKQRVALALQKSCLHLG